MLIESNNFLSILKNWFLNDFIFCGKNNKNLFKKQVFYEIIKLLV